MKRSSLHINENYRGFVVRKSKSMDLESIRIALEVARTGVRVLLMQGFRAIKMHVGLPDPNKDVERVRAVREMLGPEVVLLADAAQLIASPEASFKLARRIQEFDIGWYEEPVMGSNPRSEAKVAAAIDIPVAR